jgi:hypothetical protein
MSWLFSQALVVEYLADRMAGYYEQEELWA